MVRTLFDPRRHPHAASEQVLDSGALVLFFPGPRSVTGEDVLEFHVHGGPAVVRAVLTAISSCAKGPGSHRHVRYAEPGEFTRRAFLNDRLDLTQVEALGDTLTAETEQQRRLAVRGTAGGLSKRYEAWRQQLLRARAELEALIDFSEDQHLEDSPASLVSSVVAQITNLKRYITNQRDNAMRGELLRSGIKLALLGAPNVGKSSLMNCILGREAAIVSAEAGTTRDVIDTGIDIGGWHCRLGDTAGLRDETVPLAPDSVGDANGSRGHSTTVGVVEREGIRRAKRRARESDVVLVVLSVEKSGGDGGLELQMPSDVIATARSCSEEPHRIVVVVNKMDQLPAGGAAGLPPSWIERILEVFPGIQRDTIFGISCKSARESGSGQTDPGSVQVLLHGLQGIFAAITSPIVLDDHGASYAVAHPQHIASEWEEALGATERQRLLLDECLTHLDDFVSHAGRLEAAELDVVVAAEGLRAAAVCLAKITGTGEAGDVEEVLGVVFDKYRAPLPPLKREV